MTDPIEAARTAFFEGVSRYEAGDAVGAARCFEEALRLAPGRVSVLVNLGSARLKLGQAHAALESFDAALATDPALEDAGYGRASALSGLRRHAETLQALDQLLHHHPEHGPGWLLHGQTLQMLDRHDESLASYRRAVAAQPDLGLAWMLLGQRQAELGEDEEAAAAFERAIALAFEVDTNRYLLAALGRGTAPPSAPAAYVRALFDGYADDFETHLVGTLRYRAHEHVAQAALADLGVATSALDLGCGTGLCGALLRAHVRRLVGIDLSTTMDDAARRRGVYHEVAQAELVEHLQRLAVQQPARAVLDVVVQQLVECLQRFGMPAQPAQR